MPFEKFDVGQGGDVSEKAVKTCWFHKWGRWELFNRKITYVHLTTSNPYDSIETWQRRRCIKCGYSQEDEVRPS